MPTAHLASSFQVAIHIQYRARRFAFLAAFLCALAYFFMALRCFLDAFLNILFCFLADALDACCDLRRCSATPGLCALTGIDHVTLKPTSSIKTTIRFTRISFLTSKPTLVYTRLAPSRQCGEPIFIGSTPSPSADLREVALPESERLPREIRLFDHPTSQNTRPSW